MEYKKKLIEVALPLEAINKACAYEKMPGIGPHPRGIHLWWARRPLAAARAVIFSSLVDDPSSHPEQFPTEEEQSAERQRLFRLMEELVKWENSNNENILNAAKAEIMKSTDGSPPALLDPFAGGGAIPLEAQRLGLEAHASDLNPVAVMINKAMIEIPPKFAGQPPVNPESMRLPGTVWTGTAGLAEDVRYYGEWMKKEAIKRIGHLYPKVKVPKEQGGGEATVIAWIWTRTVKCPNPACGCEMPLASNFVLAIKKGRAAYIQPIFQDSHIHYTVKTDNGKPPAAPKTARGAKFKCIKCGESTVPDYIKEEALAGRMGNKLMAIVAGGSGGKIYLSPDEAHINAANVIKPQDYPNDKLAHDRRAIWCPLYGLDTFDKLYTNRQLTALTTFCELIKDAQTQIENDGGAKAYAEAVSVFLAFAVDRSADFSNAVTRWVPSNEKIMNLFARQGIPMTWDFPEGNILADSVGGFTTIANYIAQCILKLPQGACKQGYVSQSDAQSYSPGEKCVVSTDPPYYDNIGYADLSDFFYVWLRRSLRKLHPDLYKTMLVPKAEELVATPYRFDGSVDKARNFFEKGMLETFRQVNTYALTEVPVTIYYAFKQNESDEDNITASTGWETMLSAIVQAGFSITGTWPMRTEQAFRAVSMNTNALASSIVLVCRKRPAYAPVCTRRDFINELKREFKPALAKLQASNIAPVDLAQSAIGPGMGVYSRFSKVLEADGTPMSVRSALQIINQKLDLYFTEQDGELDRDSRFCVDLFSQYAFNEMKFGEADVLARAKNTSVEKLVGRGVLYAQKGVVRLLTREEIPERVESSEQIVWLLTQQFTRAMETGGIVATAQIVAGIFGSNAEHAKALAYRLFTIAERKGWAGEAYAYNSLVIAWPDVQSKAAELAARITSGKQITLFNSADK